ncbi:MAG TPA: conjugal transfer protein [Symbiobacteriaceae bacterium]|jgi:hypothetical protein|nr:conjugal transfer protein [Symbiobacteriaceae bacterium]
MTDRTMRIRTYAQVWRLERVIYQIEGISLPFAVTVQQVGVFFTVAAAMALLARVLPFLGQIGLVGRYLLIPALASWFLTQQKLDGKAPHRWLWGMLRYWSGPRRLSRLQPLPDGRRTRVKLYAGVSQK